MTRPTLASLARDLAEGRTTSQRLTEGCLAAIDDQDGQGARTFLHVDRETALAQARAVDLLRTCGATPPSRYAGIPISIKDLFDIAGQVTRAGSIALDGASPAREDAETVARLRRAGFVFIGRTNMSEFAFSGVGTNPHYGTPLGVWDRASERIPGGSSSGATISVTDSMAFGALGTDTGGSCRIPAAFNGLVGYKPTARRVPLKGALPLSFSLDSIGPIAGTVACCAALDAILANESEPELGGLSLDGIRFAVPNNFVVNDLDAAVSADFERALSRLSRAGARVTNINLPELDTIPQINALGGFAAAESFAWHRRLLDRRGDAYDPRVRVRVERGAKQTAADYIELCEARARFIAAMEKTLAPYDAMLMPTVPIVAPRIEELTADDAFARINLLVLRNPSVINLLDGCAISIPMHEDGEAPAGISLAAPGGHDRHIFRLATAASALLSR